MPESLVTQENTTPLIDLDLFLKFLPGVRVGSSIMRLDTIEHVESFPDGTTQVNGNEIIYHVSNTVIVTHSSGSEYVFDPEEAVDLENAIKVVIANSEKAQQAAEENQRRMMDQAAQDAMIRMSVNPNAGPSMKTGFPSGFRKR